MNYSDWENKGWSDMRVQLDKEMPEKRKRGFIWFILITLLLTGGGAFAYWGLNHQTQDAQIADNRPQDLYSTDVSHEEQADEFSAVNETIERPLDLNAGNEEAKSKLRAVTIEPVVSKDIIKTDLSIGNTIVPSVKDFKYEESPILSITRSNPDDDNEQIPEETKDSDFRKNVSNRKEKVIGLLPRNIMEPLAQFEALDKLPIISTINRKTKRSLIWSAETGVLLGKGEIDASWSLGFGIEKAVFKRDRVRISTGYFIQPNNAFSEENSFQTRVDKGEIILDSHHGLYSSIGYHKRLFLNGLFASVNLGYQLDLKRPSMIESAEQETVDVPTSLDPFFMIDDLDANESSAPNQIEKFSSFYNDFTLRYERSRLGFEIGTRYYWNLPRQYTVLSKSPNWRLQARAIYRISP